MASRSDRSDEERGMQNPNVFGALGFLLALFGLVFFWTTTGVALWALGALISLIGAFRAPRGFALFGLGVSCLSVAFAGYFLEEKSFAGKIFSAIGQRESVETASGKFSARGGAADKGRGRGARAESGVPVGSDPAPAPNEKAPRGVAFPRNSEIPLAAADDSSAGTPADFPAGAESADAEDDDAFPTLPVAAFQTISRQRATWPRNVRLRRARVITLTDDKTREIIGKMQIPAGTSVRVLDVRSDGALTVLDCTEQIFRILAADTDFAEEYALKAGN